MKATLKTPPEHMPQWRLKSGLLYAGLGKHYSAALVGPEDATVFDGRDNPETKAGFYAALFNRPFEKENL